SLLVDQCTSFKRLVINLLDHFDAHVGVGLEFAFTSRWSFLGIRPVRRGSVWQHHVEKLLEILSVLPHRFRVGYGFIDSGPPIGGGNYGRKIETSVANGD